VNACAAFRLGVLVFLVTCGGAAETASQTIKVPFTGRVRSFSVTEGTDPFAGRITVDTLIQGHYIYDPNVPDRAADPTVGDYPFTDLTLGMVADVGGFQFHGPTAPNPLGTTMLIWINDDSDHVFPGADFFGVAPQTAVDAFGNQIGMGLLLRDLTGAALTSDNLVRPDFRRFHHRSFRIVRTGEESGGNVAYEIVADVDTGVTVLPRPAFPVVLVHGTCSSYRTWDETVEGFRARDWRDGGVLTGTNSAPVADADFYRINFTDPLIQAGLESWSAELNLQLSRIKHRRAEAGLSASKFIIVAHSAGGLAARGYLQSVQYRDDISHLITYGTPHSGIPDASLWRRIVEESEGCRHVPSWAVSEGIQEMDATSEYLRSLNSRPFPPGVLHTSLVGQWDGSCLTSIALDRPHDCVVPSGSQYIDRVRTPPSASLVQSRQTLRKHEDQPDDITHLLWAIARSAAFSTSRIGINVASPVDIEVTDPTGRVISKALSDIDLAKYEEIIETDGSLHDQVTIPVAAEGAYSIRVVPNHDASPTDTFSITMQRNDTMTVVAKDVMVASIPDEAYLLLLPEPRKVSGHLLQPVVNAGTPGPVAFAILSEPGWNAFQQVAQRTVTFGKSGKEISVSHCLSVAMDVNSDKLSDLVCVASAEATGLLRGDTEASFEAQTTEGGLLDGTAAVVVKGRK
jgi:hypothetical protein